MTLSKRRNLRQLVKSYAQIHKKKASYKGRTDSLQSLDHTVAPSWLKATDNKYKCHQLTPDEGAGGLDQPTQVTTLPLAHRGRAPSLTGRHWPGLLAASTGGAEELGQMAGWWGKEKFWAPPFHCNYLIWQSFTHPLLLHPQGVRLASINYTCFSRFII